MTIRTNSKNVQNAIAHLIELAPKLDQYGNQVKLCVLAGKLSPRKWYVFYHYQPMNTQVNDPGIVGHPQDFIEQPTVRWMTN